MDTFVGVDLLLDRDLIVGARLETSADADVHAFGVLAKHDEVDVSRRASFQRAETLVEQLDRPVVDVEIELEARAEQDVARMAVVGHPRIPERADEDRVELPQQIVAVRRDRLAGLQKVVGAPGQVLELEPTAELLANASSTFNASAVTSFPIPSPAMTAIRISAQPAFSHQLSAMLRCY